jgi:hypothetical protein
MEKILWSPKIRREKLWDLYQSDAAGALDEDAPARAAAGRYPRMNTTKANAIAN